jgi:hypothetical protein
MKHSTRSFSVFLASILIALTINPSTAQDKKVTIEELISRHLESIGSAEARAAVKSRVLGGPIKFVVRTGSPYQEETIGRIVCAGAKFRYTIVWPRSLRDRKEEEIIFDGERVATGLLQYQKEQPLSSFFFRHQLPLQEGLIGGTLSTTWTLMRIEAMQPRLEYKGLRKVDGREVHAVNYRKRKGLMELKITLYFEAATFRHIRTDYLFEIDTALGGNPDAASRLTASRQLLTEEFDDFRAVEGLTLPHRYKLQLTQEAGNRSYLMDWELSVQKLSHKEAVEDALFKAK